MSHAMSTERAKGSRRGLNADQQIEAALRDGLSEDSSRIDTNPIYSRLAPSSEPTYDTAWQFWEAYKKKYPDSSPSNMKDMKHIAEAIARSTPGRLDKEMERPTVKTVRQKVRVIMSTWERKTHLTIPPAVHASMVPYIKDVLRYKVPLSIKEKTPTFLTIENYVDMEELLWQRDHHNYVHEGCRVDLSALLKMHCYTSARLQEVCKAKYKDLICMVALKDGEPEIKISLKREFTKGMQDTPKKPKHPLYERMRPAPPLLANGLLFILAIIISSGAFKDYKTIEDVLAASPQTGRKYRIMDWEDCVLDSPVFPEMSAAGPTKKAKNEGAWGNQCSDWAKRAGITGGLGLHASRREALIKVDDSGYSLGQVMKFAAHRNPNTLVGHYLDDMSNVNGAAVFLGLEPRRDLTEDFRSASMKRNTDVRYSLPEKSLDMLRQRQDFADLCKQIDKISIQVTATVTEERRRELKAQRRRLYDQRQRLVDEELASYRGTQHEPATQREVDDQGEWQRSYFDRVVRHMVPERDRLARNLPLAIPIRSPDGMSALRDLIALRKDDSRVAYQEALRPLEGRCPVSTCGQDMDSIEVKGRWKHVYQCSRDYYEKQFGFVEFCFRCSTWITSETDWETHCQSHIDNMDIPFRCDPVTFRHSIACAGYCSGCIGKKWLPASLRLKQFLDRTSWQRHISVCLPAYVKGLHSKDTIPCPHFLCTAVFQSESDLWTHLGDIHSTHKPDMERKRQRPQREDGCEAVIAIAKRRRTTTRPRKENSQTVLGRKFLNISASHFDPDPAVAIEDAKLSKNPSSSSSASHSSAGDLCDDDHSTDLSLLSLSDDSTETFSQIAGHCYSPRTTLSATLDRLSEFEPSKPDTVVLPTDLRIPTPDIPGTLMETIDPQLLDALPLPVPSLSLPNDTIKAACASTSTLTPVPSLAEIEAPETRSLHGSGDVEGHPVPADAEGDIWEAEELLAKWKQGKMSLFLVKWKGFPHEDNTWERRKDISAELVQDFEETYQGNFTGVHLLKKRLRKGKVEYLVKWKGRPESENSWERENTISRELILEFEAS